MNETLLSNQISYKLLILEIGLFFFKSAIFKNNCIQ